MSANYAQERAEAHRQPAQRMLHEEVEPYRNQEEELEAERFVNRHFARVIAGMREKELLARAEEANGAHEAFRQP